MEATPHIFLAGPSTIEFAKEHGVKLIPEEDLITDFAREALDDFLHQKGEATSELG